MKKLRFSKLMVVWLATAGLCLPEALLAAAPPSVPVVSDVALRDGGVLVGQVVNVDGAALASVPVTLRSGGQDLVATTTDRGGYFAFSGLQLGTYQILTPTTVTTYQTWTAHTAPPQAQTGVLIVVGADTVRGQQTPGERFGALGRPLLFGGLIAAAIAVPIAVANSNRQPASQ
jgi:hypothetical protein